MFRKTSCNFSWLLVAAGALGLPGCSDDEPRDESNPDVDADTYAATSEGRLVYFERASGEINRGQRITGLGSGERVLGIDFRPADGALYAVTSDGNVYVIDTASGEATLKSELSADPADTSDAYESLDGDVFGVNFNPVADRLRVVSNSGQNLRINVETGATSTDANLNPGAPSIAAATYTNSFAAACRTRLLVIDSSSNELFLQDPPNAGTLTKVGDLTGADADGGWAAFEVVTSDTGSNRAFAAFPSERGARLYDVDLNNGDLLNSRTLRLRSGEELRGVSAAPPETAPSQAPGDLLGVTVENELVSFNRGAPGKLCTQAEIDGIGIEQILGMDVRPADGGLYALSDAGKLYTLDVATGEATLHSTLIADAMDTSEPFTSLPDTDFGVGFNPVPDRLRVVSGDGRNYRINVDTGATTTDASLSPASMAVHALAYTNSIAGATSTALFAVDTASAALTLIGGNPATGGACPDDANNPNCGNVTSLGPLGVDNLSDVTGFDISADDGAAVAFLAVTIGDATTSSLYVVDLESGAATPPPGVANPTIGGGRALRDITLAE
ncbi:MAG TPA: DUF4394 domain-containing protein [Polyangiaceae bacterium]|nr:DUF4394 domain-containing protein [Polyangiaceae bacterium]